MTCTFPQQKLFGVSSPFHVSVPLIWATVFSTTLISRWDKVFCEGVEKMRSDFTQKVPPGLIQLDSDDYFDSGNGNGYETLRQLSMASSQSFMARRLFNCSVALTVPVFSFTLPERFPEGATVDLANQMIFVVFAFLVEFLIFAVPVVFTGTRPYDIFDKDDKDKDKGRSIHGHNIMHNLLHAGESSESLMNFMGANLRNKIGLDPYQCIQRTICDAHRYPDKYGLFALPFQLAFPSPVPNDENWKNPTIFQEAAQTGEYNRTEKCFEKYKCFFDVMDLAVYLVDYYNTPQSGYFLPEEQI